jgi:hypothetical protein
MKIDNDEMWSKIKGGELKGLSIEGYFVDKMQALSKPKFTDEEVLNALASILKIK